MLTARRSFTSLNPANISDVIGEFNAATAADALAAVERAVAAQVAWAGLPPNRRAAVVGGIAHAIARETHETVALVTREEGKTLAESRAEVQKSIEQFHFASQLAYLCEGATYPAEEADTLTFTVRQPVGVVVAITPYNFPISLVARKVGAALAVGNAVVLKPSPVTAACGEAIVRICREAGVPDGVLQLVQGEDASAMRALLGHPSVAAVTFTGSNPAGARVRAATGTHVRLQMELGGHNAAIVCADADLDVAAKHVAAAAFGLSGQACTATDRVLVERAVYDEFRSRIADEVRAIRVGPGTVAGVTCGPVATAAQVERITRLLSSAVATGAHIVAAAEPPSGVGMDAGYFVAPTVLDMVAADHPLSQSEIFGPLLTLVPVVDSDEAVGIVNRSRRGLATSVHTQDVTTALRFARAVTSGVVKINRRTTGNGIAPPFGGFKESSAGGFPEGGRQAIEFFTTTKTVYCGY